CGLGPRRRPLPRDAREEGAMTNGGFYTREQFMQAAAAQKQQLQWMLERAAAVREQHKATAAEVERSHAQAANDLAAALLPDLSEVAVTRATALTGFAPWRQQSPAAAANAEYAAIVRRLQDIEADPRFRDRELLRHPVTGSLSRQIAELAEM